MTTGRIFPKVGGQPTTLGEIEMSEKENGGLALASFLITVQTLGALVRNGQITMDGAREVITRSRLSLEVLGFPGEPEVTQIALRRLGSVESLLALATAPLPPGKPN